LSVADMPSGMAEAMSKADDIELRIEPARESDTPTVLR